VIARTLLEKQPLVIDQLTRVHFGSLANDGRLLSWVNYDRDFDFQALKNNQMKGSGG